MKTHNLKAFKSVEYFYQIRQLNEEQLSGEKLSAHLTNITMAFWYDLTSPIAASPDSYDIHSHGVDGPYRCLKMTPGADVIDGLYDRIQDKAADLEKALNKAFNTKAFDLKVRREGGELDLLVAFVSAEGGIFQCNSTVEGGSYGVALRIPNDEEMKVTFDSMAQVPAPSNVDDEPEMDVEPEADLDDIPELDPEAEVEEEVDLLEPEGKKIVRPEFDDFAQDEIEDEPFEPADDAEVDGGDIEDSPGTYTKLAEKFDSNMFFMQVQGNLASLKAGDITPDQFIDNVTGLVTQGLASEAIEESTMNKMENVVRSIARGLGLDKEYKARIGDLVNKLNANPKKRTPSTKKRLAKHNILVQDPDAMEEGFGNLKDAPKRVADWSKKIPTVKLTKDGEERTYLTGKDGVKGQLGPKALEKLKADGWVEVKEEDLEEDAPATSVGSVAAAAGDTGVPGHDAGPCACCGKKPCKCGPNCPTCNGVKVEQTEYRYVSLQKLNPFQR
jgi:hypothetical protein